MSCKYCDSPYTNNEVCGRCEQAKENRQKVLTLQARVAELESALTQAPYQAFLNEQRSHAKTRDRVAELETDQRRHLEAIASEARCLGHLRTNLDEKQTHIAELERELAAAREECKAWRDSHGSIGPQTPAEVPVFLREAARVDGQVAGYRIAALRAAVDAAVPLLEYGQANCISGGSSAVAFSEALSLLRAAQKAGQ